MKIVTLADCEGVTGVMVVSQVLPDAAGTGYADTRKLWMKVASGQGLHLLTSIGKDAIMDGAMENTGYDLRSYHCRGSNDHGLLFAGAIARRVLGNGTRFFLMVGAEDGRGRVEVMERWVTDQVHVAILVSGFGTAVVGSRARISGWRSPSSIWG